MKQIRLGNTAMEVPEIAVGCMRFDELDDDQLKEYLKFCLDHGLNFFDHADIYGGNECERRFGKAMKEMSVKREDYILQSKCAIRKGWYDFSKEYILKSVDEILERLQSDYLDILLLHRPDPLMDPKEVAEAFDILQAEGKVRFFGVSNFRPMQVELLKKYVHQDLIIDQLQFSITNSSMISAGMEVNMPTDGAVDRDGSVLEYCRINDMTIQTWSPFQYGNWDGTFIGNREVFPELNDLLDELAEKYDVTPTGIAAAWIFRHPAHMQLIAGTMKTSRLEEIIAGSEITLTAKEWYDLYVAAGHIIP